MKEITVLTFGAITDIAGSNRFVVRGFDSTNALKEGLEKQFPALKKIPYTIAVNKQVVNAQTLLDDNAEVALLPPFSGG